MVCVRRSRLRYLSGGSSSGSAVAVARGDSLRLGHGHRGRDACPAAFNALVGAQTDARPAQPAGTVPACRTLRLCVHLHARAVRPETVLDCAPLRSRRSILPRAPEPSAQLGERVRLGYRAQKPRIFGIARALGFFQVTVERSGAAAELVEVDCGSPRHSNLLIKGVGRRRLAAVGAFFEQSPQSLHPVVRGFLEGGGATAPRRVRGQLSLGQSYAGRPSPLERIDALCAERALPLPIEAALADPTASTRTSARTQFRNLRICPRSPFGWVS